MIEDVRSKFYHYYKFKNVNRGSLRVDFLKEHGYLFSIEDLIEWRKEHNMPNNRDDIQNYINHRLLRLWTET